jgi:hypothetical protein
VLYDLGAGVGKVVLQIAMSEPVRGCVGVELSRTRIKAARSALRQARAFGMIRARQCLFRHDDILRANLSDATVVYTCSTAFSDLFMRRLVRRLAQLRPGLRLVSTQDLDPHPSFRLLDVLALDMSWKRRSRVYVYRLEHRDRRRS